MQFIIHYRHEVRKQYPQDVRVNLHSNLIKSILREPSRLFTEQLSVLCWHSNRLDNMDIFKGFRISICSYVIVGSRLLLHELVVYTYIYMHVYIYM